MKKNYIHPATCATRTATTGMIALSKSENPAKPDLPSLTKERQEIDEDEEFEMLNILREQEEGGTKNLW